LSGRLPVLGLAAENRGQQDRDASKYTMPTVLRIRMRAAWIFAFSLVISAMAAGEGSYRIVGYVTDKAEIRRIDATKVTTLIYAFAQVRSSGDVYFDDPKSAAYLERLQGLRSANANLKLTASVGGWGADHFSDAALTASSRERFATSILELVQKHGLDGFDIDWEYPGQPGAGCKFRPEDRQNFTLLLQAVRLTFDRWSAKGNRPLVLTIASASGEYFKHADIPAVEHCIDWFNVMTYDFYGSLTAITGHHTGLYRTSPTQGPFDFASGVVGEYLAAGVPASKLVLGCAFYGKSWTGVRAANNGILQPYSHFGDWIDYDDIVTKWARRPGFQSGWDDNAKAPYLWSPATGIFVSYENPESIAWKATYVKQIHLGGMMYWEQSEDPKGVLLDAISTGLR
jgi:chitinase